jgi:serine O-acetyltransferase
MGVKPKAQARNRLRTGVKREETIRNMNYTYPINTAKEIATLSRSILFPDFYGDDIRSVETKKMLLKDLLATRIVTEAQAATFIERLDDIGRSLQTDVEAAYNGDPAAKSYDEIICCYPVIKALINYRVAHELLKMGVELVPRILTEMAHSETGIDIHPGAEIGDYFTIDHGTGVVIGETCIIGRNVKLYQGVTLGAKSFPLDANGNPIKGIARHPILEDDVIVYSNSTILGRITVGRGAIIGGNVWITQDVAAGARIVQYRN